MSKKKEGVFCSQLRKDFYAGFPDDFFRKIPDSFGGRGAKFTPKSPIDIYISYDREFYGIEAKYHDKKTAWEFAQVKPHQVDELLQIRRRNFSYIFINLKGDNKVYKETNVIVGLDVKSFVNLRRHFLERKNKKSILPQELVENADFVLTREKSENGTRWDWEKFFKTAKGDFR